MKLYRLRMRPERSPAVQRVVEFAARHTLLDVHDVIQKEFGLDNDHLHAFFLSGQHWDKASEISGGATPGELGRTSRVRLHELRLELGQRFAYVFDFGDEHWLSLDVEGLSDSDAPPVAPRLLESIGTASAQYGEVVTSNRPDVSPLVALAEDFIALFPQAEEDDGFDADGDEEPGLVEFDDELGLDDEDDDEDEPEGAFELSPEELDSAHALARQLADGLGGDGDRFMALEQACETNLLTLLADLPAALALAGKVDEAAELAQRFAFLDPPHFLGERAHLLAEAGRREEALAQVTENLESMDGDTWVEVKAADVYGALGDSERAEAMLRAVLARQVEQQTRDGAFDRLLDLLTEQGRGAEARALLAEEKLRLNASIKAHPDTEQRLAPKVGRNDPCPCGSGKKHKKCCLA